MKRLAHSDSPVLRQVQMGSSLIGVSPRKYDRIAGLGDVGLPEKDFDFGKDHGAGEPHAHD